MQLLWSDISVDWDCTDGHCFEELLSMWGIGISGEVCYILLWLLGHPLPRMCATSAGEEGLEALHPTSDLSWLFRIFPLEEIDKYVAQWLSRKNKPKVCRLLKFNLYLHCDWSLLIIFCLQSILMQCTMLRATQNQNRRGITAKLSWRCASSDTIV